MLDLDDSDSLEYEEVVGVLEGRKNVGIGKDEEFKNELVEKMNTYIRKFKKMVGY